MALPVSCLTVLEGDVRIREIFAIRWISPYIVWYGTNFRHDLVYFSIWM